MKIFRISVLFIIFCFISLSPAMAVNSTLKKQNDKATKIENTTVKAPKKSLKQRVKETLKLIFKKPKTQQKSAKSAPLNMARLSLILGLLGYITFGILSLPAFILGIVALKRINESGGFYTGRGMAIAGIVLGAIPIVMLLLLFIVFISFNNF